MAELLQDWVSRQAERRPEATAVVLNGERLGYGELDSFSGRLASTLRVRGCEPGDRVCLLMPKSPLAIACIVGIYKAGCIYVPLDPASPASRLGKILGSCRPRCLLAAGGVRELLRELLQPPERRAATSLGWLDAGPCEGITPDFSLNEVQASTAIAPRHGARSGDPAHILFTSGSTGSPKGVIITHGNVIAFVEWALEHFGLGTEDRLSCHPPLHFDLSVFDIWGAFAAGAELHIVPPDCNVLPHRLPAWMRASALTQWFSVPSVLNYLTKFDAVRPGDFQALRRLLWCGEVLPTPALIYWMRRLPRVRFTNLYGPTEATIASSYYDVTACPAAATAAIPIGHPCGGEELRVLDAALEPVVAGGTGDLYILGAGLSPGYWENPEETRRAFVERRGADGAVERLYRTGDLARLGSDGLVYYVGREDFQVKSRGYRIELGEIESALNTMPSLRECAVVAVPSHSFDGASICCAYVPARVDAVTPADLREELGKLLPDYMIPSRWQVWSELPKNGSGKIDRRRLKEAWQHDGPDRA